MMEAAKMRTELVPEVFNVQLEEYLGDIDIEDLPVFGKLPNSPDSPKYSKLKEL